MVLFTIQALAMLGITLVVLTMVFSAIANSVPMDMSRKRYASRNTRWHWNDPRQVAKLRHPSARADVYECWDPRCDCHFGRSVPYDWEHDPDLTSDTPHC